MSPTGPSTFLVVREHSLSHIITEVVLPKPDLAMRLLRFMFLCCFQA